MSWRVVVISSRAKLELKLGYLVIRSTETKRILLDEISVLLIENTGCVVSSALLCELQERKVCVIFCDFKHNPLSQLIPLHGSYDSSERIRIQLNWKQETKDLVWKAIIEDKIRKQAGQIFRLLYGEIFSFRPGREYFTGGCKQQKEKESRSDENQ